MSHARKLAVGTVALGAIAGSGVAIAATTGSTPQEESEAIIASAAERLGVSEAELSEALKDALKARLDAAVADGRLSEERAAELKERIESGGFPLVGLGPPGAHGHRFGGPVDLEAAADYLGLTPEELRTELRQGSSLAEVADAEDKSVDGLVDVLVTAAEERLDEVPADLEERIRELVNREPGLRFGHRF